MLKDLGQIEDAEKNALNAHRERAKEIVLHIGQLEVQKARLLGQLGEVETRSQEIAQQALSRLGVASGTPFNITADGKVQIVESEQGAQ